MNFDVNLWALQSYNGVLILHAKYVVYIFKVNVIVSIRNVPLCFLLPGYNRSVCSK